MLPILNGDSVIKQLRTYTDIPVIVVSAKTMVQSKIELLRLGADDYMTKPFFYFFTNITNMRVNCIIIIGIFFLPDRFIKILL